MVGTTNISNPNSWHTLNQNQPAPLKIIYNWKISSKSCVLIMTFLNWISSKSRIIVMHKWDVQLIKWRWSDESWTTHSLRFVLSCDVLLNIFLSKVYFHIKHFVYCKRSTSLITTSEWSILLPHLMYPVAVWEWHHSNHSLWCYNG